MSARTATRIAAVMWIAAVSATVMGIVIARDTPTAWSFLLELAPVALAYVTVGAVIGARRPANPIGWLFAGWGMVMSALGLAQCYADHTLLHAGPVSSAQWAGWTVALLWHPSFAFLVFQLLLFPHGTLPSPRWRHFARATAGVYGLLAISTAFSPSALQIYTPGLEPPFTTPIAPIANTVADWLLGGQLLLVVTGMIAMLLRLRRARGRERQQIKGFVYAVVVAVITFVAGIFVFGEGTLFPVFGIMPIAAGVAILRQQLYDIDRVINRTVVYGVLSAVLALVYAGGVLVLGQIFGQASDLAIAGSTLGAAAVFQPARRVVQRSVDRRFNRRRYDAARLVSTFAQRCRQEVDLDAIATDLSAAVAQSMEPAQLALWWRPVAPATAPERAP